MYSTTKKGFTLLEILIALAVGSIIILGLFKTLQTVMKSHDFVLKKSNSMEIIYKTISLIQKDIRCKIGSFQVSSAFGKEKLSFKTTDSLRYAGSVPVNVSYYIENKDGKSYLVREESHNKETLKIRLTDFFKDIRFKFYYQGRWVSSPETRTIKVILTTNSKREYSFVAKGMLDE